MQNIYQVDVGVNREALVQSPIVVIYISIVVIYVSITTPCGQLKKKKKIVVSSPEN